MNPGPFAQVEARTAAEVCRRYPASDEAKGLLRDAQTPRQFLDALVERGQWADACEFLAHALPKREAVWWGTLCVSRFLGPSPPPRAAAALSAAQRWVADPSDPNRRKALPAAEEGGLDTPAGCLATATFFTAGSIAPEGLPEVPPPESATGKAVAGAVKLSALLKEPEKAPETFAAFLKLGSDVADGKNRWPERKT